MTVSLCGHDNSNYG